MEVATVTSFPVSFTYAVIDTFSIVFLLILYASTREHGKGLTENRCFRFTVLMTVLILLCDMVAWMLNGKPGGAHRWMLWVANILCYVLSGCIAASWFFYVGLKLDRNRVISRLGKALLCLPCVFLAVTSVLSPWTHWLFWLDEQNVYQRGGLFAFQIIIPFGYLIAAAFRAALHATRVRLRQQRRECLTLASFIIFPLIGGILQISVYGLSLAWPCTALSLMLVYVSQQNQKISLDALTGLNNRGQFDKHIYNCMERADNESPFALFMLDIDDFKRVNDLYGHTAGDAALVAAAQVLKTALGDSNAFLARYGGDEFAVVMYYASRDEVDATLGKIDAAVERYNARADASKFRLVFSVGYVLGDKQRFQNYQDMITAADAQMYLQKQQHKAARA